MPPSFLSFVLFAVVVAGGVAFSIRWKKLTLPAAITGAFLCASIFFGVGWVGVAQMTAFFVIGTATTSWRKKTKESIGLAQGNGGRRNTGQVLANGGVSGFLGLLAVLFPQHRSLFLFLIAAGFSSATADTISSELGSVYGKKFYDVLSFRAVQKGPDGVVSLEGILFGILGSIIIALIHTADAGFDSTFLWIVVAGTAGNLSDSYLGATLERKRLIGNDAVNFLNTAVAAAIASLFYLI